MDETERLFVLEVNTLDGEVTNQVKEMHFSTDGSSLAMNLGKRLAVCNSLTGWNETKDVTPHGLLEDFDIERFDLSGDGASVVVSSASSVPPQVLSLGSKCNPTASHADNLFMITVILQDKAICISWIANFTVGLNAGSREGTMEGTMDALCVNDIATVRDMACIPFNTSVCGLTIEADQEVMQEAVPAPFAFAVMINGREERAARVDNGRHNFNSCT